MRIVAADFDAEKIARSGQCFRMTSCRDDWQVRAMGRTGVLRKAEDGYELDCPETDEPLWRDYFDLDTDYAAFVPDAADECLREAARCAKGIRILRQEPFETLITFILSQRRSIPAIRTAVERLCAEYGRDGAFPEPAVLASASEEALRGLGLGYRAPYVRDAARLVMSGELDLKALSALEDDALEVALRRVNGVGPKVARCVMLFAYHRLDAFPVDVWIDRVLREHYPNGFPAQKYPGYAGVMQQYLFCWVRSQAVTSQRNRAT